MDKIEIYHYLKRQNIAYEITEHKAVFNMEEAEEFDLRFGECVGLCFIVSVRMKGVND